METPTALWWRSGRGPDLHRVGCLAVLEGDTTIEEVVRCIRSEA